MEVEKHTVMCAILGHQQIFSVEIDGNKQVSVLKRMIKQAKHVLAPFDADAPTLHLAEIISSKDEVAVMNELKRASNNLGECKKLLDWIELSEYFREEPPSGKMYVVLVQPPQGESIYCRGVVLMADVVTDTTLSATPNQPRCCTYPK